MIFSMDISSFTDHWALIELSWPGPGECRHFPESGMRAHQTDQVWRKRICGEKSPGPVRKSAREARYCEDLQHGTERSGAARCCVMT